jgi:hypothetical protein
MYNLKQYSKNNIKEISISKNMVLEPKSLL